MDNPLVSVVLPTFNRAKLLKRSAGSVLNQTYRALELIVVDDGSTDETASAVKSLGDHRVHMIKRDANGGPAATRNQGMDRAKGDYVAFQDSDDEWLPNKLEQQVAALNSDVSTGFVYTDMIRVASNGDEQRHYSPEILGGRVVHPDTGFYQTYGLGLQSLLVRRDLAQTAGPLDEAMSYYEDLEWFQRLVTVAPAHRLAEPLVKYYDTGGLTTNWRNELAGRLHLLELYGEALRSEAPSFLRREQVLLNVRRWSGPLTHSWTKSGDFLYEPPG